MRTEQENPKGQPEQFLFAQEFIFEQESSNGGI